ncbi:hypothetical protein [Alteromonas antoniana]|uniref:hypothetical protein n=1 Tax=Alteromonas antoniana TaxID=2803813 RepID=UPI001C479138|nr:hypothetical protein [Alteromonas antoniana]
MSLKPGDTVSHPAISVKMKVNAPASLGAVAFSNGTRQSAGRTGYTNCSYIDKGQRIQRDFPTHELRKDN